MKTISDYIEAAKNRQGFVTDADLDYALGFKRGMICRFRKETVYPTEQTMIKIADMADISIQQALLELSYWKADGAAKVAYEQIIQNLAVA